MTTHFSCSSHQVNGQGKYSSSSKWWIVMPVYCHKTIGIRGKDSRGQNQRVTHHINLEAGYKLITLNMTGRCKRCRICACARICAIVYVSVHACADMCVYVPVHAHVCASVCMCAHVYLCAYVRAWVCMYECACACACACTCMCVCVVVSFHEFHEAFHWTSVTINSYICSFVNRLLYSNFFVISDGQSPSSVAWNASLRNYAYASHEVRGFWLLQGPVLAVLSWSKHYKLASANTLQHSILPHLMRLLYLPSGRIAQVFRGEVGWGLRIEASLGKVEDFFLWCFQVDVAAFHTSTSALGYPPQGLIRRVKASARMMVWLRLADHVWIWARGGWFRVFSWQGKEGGRQGASHEAKIVHSPLEAFLSRSLRKEDPKKFEA